MAAANLANTTDLNKVHYIREALPVVERNLVFAKFGQVDEMPRGDGNSFRFIRFTKLGTTASDYTANTSGDSPEWAPSTPADTLLNVTPDFLFGPGYEWNEAREYTSWVSLPANLRKNVSLQAAEVFDLRVRDIVIAGTNVVYANGRASRDELTSADVIDMDDIFRAVENLKANDAKPLAKVGNFACIISPYTERSLLTDTAFRDLVEHSRAKDEFAGHLGSLGGVDFFVTTHAPSIADSGSASSVGYVEQTLIVGEGAYGVTKILYDNFDIIYTAPGGHGDEWKNKHKLTWKAAMKAVILDENNMVRLESSRAS